MGRATRRRPRPTGLNTGVFQGRSLPVRVIRPPLEMTSFMCQLLGGRTPGDPGPSLNVTFSAFATFLWYTRRTPHLVLPASLILIDRSCAVLGAATTDEPPKKASQPQRSTGGCRSTATGSVASALIFSQMLGLGSAESNSPELPSPPSDLLVLAVILVAGLVVVGEAYWLSV